MPFDVLDPSNAPAVPTALAPRVRGSLRGGRIGVIWNGRPNGDVAIRVITDRLVDEHSMDVVAFVKKPLIGNVAPESVFQELATKPVDFVLAGVGD